MKYQYFSKWRKIWCDVPDKENKNWSFFKPKYEEYFYQLRVKPTN